MSEKKTLRFDVKSLEPDGSFEGNLAVYNNVDAVGDRIVPGAFSQTLQARGGVVPMLWSHNPDEPIGTLQLTDTPRALHAKGQLILDVGRAREVYSLLKARIVKGLSIGYDVVRDSVENGVRVLKELKLYEGSLCVFPANPEAIVQSVKSQTDEREVIREFKRLLLDTVKATQPRY